MKVWDTRAGRELLAFQDPAGDVVCFSPDGTRLATASGLGTVKVWDTRAGQEVFALKGHTGSINSACFSPDGHRLATASERAYVPGKFLPGEIRVWDPSVRQEALTLQGNTVCFSPDGSRLATASYDQTVRVRDARTGQELLALKGQGGPVQGVCFSPDSARLATASWGPDAAGKSVPGEVRVWDARSGHELLAFRDPAGGVQSVCFSPDGSRLATASGGHQTQTAQVSYGHSWRQETRMKPLPGEVRVWDARSGHELLSLKGHAGPVTGVCFSPDGTRLATASGGSDAQERPLPGEVRVWDARSGQELLSLKGHTGPVNGVCFSPDGSRLATASYDQTVKVWDARSGQELLALKGHTGPVQGVCFSPDGARLASASWDGTVRVWDVHTGQETFALRQLTGVLSVCWSPDGTRLAGASSGLQQTVRVWDGQGGNSLPR